MLPYRDRRASRPYDVVGRDVTRVGVVPATATLAAGVANNAAFSLFYHDNILCHLPLQ